MRRDDRGLHVDRPRGDRLRAPRSGACAAAAVRVRRPSRTTSVPLAFDAAVAAVPVDRLGDVPTPASPTTNGSRSRSAGSHLITRCELVECSAEAVSEVELVLLRLRDRASSRRPVDRPARRSFVVRTIAPCRPTGSEDCTTDAGRLRARRGRRSSSYGGGYVTSVPSPHKVGVRLAARTPRRRHSRSRRT